MVSLYLCLDHPLFLLPSISNSYILRMSFSSSLQQAWPNYCNFLLLIRSKIAITLAFRLISSLLWCSSKLFCRQWRSILISHEFTYSANRSVKGQVSFPYSIEQLLLQSYISAPWVLLEFFCYITPASSLHLFQAFLIFSSTSFSCCKLIRRYLKLVYCGSSCKFLPCFYNSPAAALYRTWVCCRFAFLEPILVVLDLCNLP